MPLYTFMSDDPSEASHTFKFEHDDEVFVYAGRLLETYSDAAQISVWRDGIEILVCRRSPS